jgi:hypothetical protein
VRDKTDSMEGRDSHTEVHRDARETEKKRHAKRETRRDRETLCEW